MFIGGGKEMSITCKHCGGSTLVKNGIIHNKQRYKCKSCGKNTREGDARVRYSTEQKIKVVKMYLERRRHSLY